LQFARKNQIDAPSLINRRTHPMPEKIYVDANQPASLIDGDRWVNCRTLGEAIAALDNLPADRKNVARIKCGDRLYASDEIDRLHHRKPAPP
jgi:hypothetical protein